MIKRWLVAFFLLTAVGVAQRPDDVFAGQKAPEFKKQDVWINTAPLTMESLRGKVVMINFWAWDCPYCAEAFPHVKELYDKYSKQGLIVVGVHTPRFEYEKDIAKLKEAVGKKGIQYPVVADNNSEIWLDYACDGWPSQYVVDQDGVIRLSHSGAGRYEDIEAVIQKLLSKSK